MVHQNREETELRTFNTAKKFSEEVLFPLMEAYQRYIRISDFGYETLEGANMFTEEIREIQRFNGLKACSEVTLNLVNAIKSTVLLHNNKDEKEMMNQIITVLEKTKSLFYDNKGKFFTATYRGNKSIEVIDRGYFEKVKQIIVACYVNTEILMTRNKLLFSDAKDDFASDAEIQERITKEYVGD